MDFAGTVDSSDKLKGKSGNRVSASSGAQQFDDYDEESNIKPTEAKSGGGDDIV